MMMTNRTIPGLFALCIFTSVCTAFRRNDYSPRSRGIFKSVNSQRDLANSPADSLIETIQKSAESNEKLLLAAIFQAFATNEYFVSCGRFGYNAHQNTNSLKCHRWLSPGYIIYTLNIIYIYFFFLAEKACVAKTTVFDWYVTEKCCGLVYYGGCSCSCRFRILRGWSRCSRH